MADQSVAQVRQRTAYEQDAKQLLEFRQLSIGKTVYPKMEPSGVRTTGMAASNMFEIQLTKDVTSYQYDVNILFNMRRRDGTESKFPVTQFSEEGQGGKRRLSQPEKIERDTLSRAAIQLAATLDPGFPRPIRFFYDGDHLLISLDTINFKGKPFTEQPYVIEEGTSPQRLVDAMKQLKPNAHRLTIRIKKVERSVRLDHLQQSDVGSVEASDYNRGIMQHIEVAQLDHLVQDEIHTVLKRGTSNDVYLLDPTQHGFSPRDLPDLPLETYMAVGATKGSRIVARENGLRPVLTLDTRFAAFHKSQNLAEKLLNVEPSLERAVNGNMTALRACFIGLCIQLTHRDAPLKKIKDFGPPAAVAKLSEDSAETVQQYFKRQYNIDLQHPNLPCVEVERSKKMTGNEVYPVELCWVVDDQQVTMTQMTPAIQQKILESSTRMPHILRRNIMNQLNAMAFNDSASLAEAGIRVNHQPMQAPYRIIEPPTMKYVDTISSLDKFKGVWNAGKFIQPKNLDKWCLFGCLRTTGQPQERLTSEEFKKVCMAFMNQCQMKGMGVAPPKISRQIGNDEDELNRLLGAAVQQGLTFALILTNKDDPYMHPTIKRLEHKYGIVTQNVTRETIGKAFGLTGPKQAVTLSNIVMKTNVKLGGLNYHVLSKNQQIGQTDLFIGIGANLTAGGFKSDEAGPTVIGYAANDLAAPTALSGNYIYQPPKRHELLTIIEDIVKTCLTRYEKNRKQAPKRVFIYQDEGSQGEHGMLMKYQIPLIQNAIQPSNAKLVFVLTTKLHRTKLYPTGDPVESQPVRGVKPPDANLKIGTCIESQITNAHVPEYHQLGHYPRLGTARVPRYTVLANDAQIEMDELQTLTYHLCFNHQIITGSTSLPSPTYVAIEMAKRGRMIYNVASQKSDSNGDSSNYEHITEELSYAKSTLRDQRFNA